MVNLFDDGIASLDITGRIITRRTTSGNALPQVQTEGREGNNLAKREDSSLIFCHFDRNIRVVSHTEG